METVGWNQMSARVRVFAARHYLVHGGSIADAQAQARYKPALDVVDGRGVLPLRNSAAVLQLVFPQRFPDEGAVLALGLCHKCGAAFDDSGNCRCQD